MNLTKVLASYANKWVALSKNSEVLAYDLDIKKLDMKVKKAKLKDVVYHFVLPLDRSFAP
jgi:hypothetical protein